MNTKILSARSVSVIGILVAMLVVISRFLTIHTWNMKIGFVFVPIVIAAILYGPVTAGLVAAIGDVIGAFLFPVGTFFPGFTLTAFLTGLIFGLFLRKSQTVFKILASVLVTQLVCSQLINTFWISILYGSPFEPLFITRLYQTGIMIIVEIAFILLISKKLIPVLKNRSLI